MKKILIITDKLEHYRVPLYNSLCENYEITIQYSNFTDRNKNDYKFKSTKLNLTNKGPFTYYKNLNDFNNYDYVIFPFNLRNLNLYKLIFSKNKIGVFGPGVAASYTKKYDTDNLLFTYLKVFILNKVDFAIFYDVYPKIKFQALGVLPNKMSVAYNTVAKNKNFNIINKTFESFIFIGSLYKEKKIYDLIQAYIILYKEDNNIPNLEIIGNGLEFQNLENMIIQNNLTHKIILHGEITSDEQLLPILNKGIVCISPGQAGLSVQKCFSYAIGFITTENATTGGEMFSIIPNITGDLYNGTIDDLIIQLRKYTNYNYSKKISDNAYLYYNKYRNIELWKSGFIQNIK